MKDILTVDIERGPDNSKNPQGIRSPFQRFSWRSIGRSVYAYDADDWLNEAVPGLMFFRSFVSRRELKLSKRTLIADIVSIHADDAAFQ